MILSRQELLEQLAYAEECGKLITPPCWTTGDFCTGKLVCRASAGFDRTEHPRSLLRSSRPCGTIN